MAITLGSNIASLKGQRQLSRTSEELGSVFQRLSSGQRINKASDDAAGLSIADSLKAQSRIFNQGVRNLNDGLSLLSIADSAIENLSDIVIRLEELAEQSANGVYTSKQRKAMDAEAQALSNEFFRISKTTEFNGQRLLTGEFNAVNLQAGIGVNAVLSVGVGGAIGTGTFGVATSNLAESSISYSIALGDLNGDGIQDIVTAGNAGSGYATVRLGLGNGTFATATSYAMLDMESRSVVLGDFNGDGILDIVSGGKITGASTEGDAGVSIRLGRGDGTFGSAISYNLFTFAPGEENVIYDIAVGDINGDGTLDIAAAGIAGGYQSPVVVLTGTGTGTFNVSSSFVPPSGQQVFGLTFEDVNQDGMLDIVSALEGGYVDVRLGQGNGTFGAGVTYQMVGSSAYAVTISDLNGDGIPDIVAAGNSGLDGYFAVRLGIGGGTFGSATSYATEGRVSNALVLTDFNGDGFLDIATTGRGDATDGYTTIRLGGGNGTFGAAVSYAAETRESYAIAVADLNGDGVPDFVTSGQSDSSVGLYTVRLSSTTAGIQPLLPFSLSTLADARQALPVFKRKREQLTAQRGEIGAFQSRIDVARNVLEVSSENFRAAESRIRDADIADESSRLVRLNILQQAASSVLAQANQQPALALQLLGRS